MNVPYEECRVYDWFELQKAICEVMGISELYFRDYHRVVGGKYKDLWHVALETIIPHGMENDTIVTMWPVEDQIEDDGFWLKDRVWARPFFEAYASLAKEIDPEHAGFLVRFSW